MAKVNEKSTKTEIWAAYQALRAEFQAHPVVLVGNNDVNINELGTALEQAKTALLTQFEAAQKVAESTTSEYVNAEQALAKRKAEIIDELERARAELQTAINQARTNWEQEQADRERVRQREVEEYTYELNKKRRAEEEAFQTKWHAKFTELNDREALIKNQEDRLKQLEETAELAPKQLESAVKESRDVLAKELKAAHEAELKESRQQSEHQRSLLELKLQTAETSLTAKDKQLADLQKQLDIASTQLKDMAVTVIRASNSPNQPLASSTS